MMLSYDVANEWLSYHEDGYLVWNKSPPRSSLKGKRLGSLHHSGYRHGTVAGVTNLLEHKLVGLLHYRVWPDMLDPIYMVKDNNRIDNLR